MITSTTLLALRTAVIDTMRAEFRDVFADYRDDISELFAPREDIPRLRTPTLVVSWQSIGIDYSSADAARSEHIPTDVQMLAYILVGSDTGDAHWQIGVLSYHVARVVAQQGAPGPNRIGRGPCGNRWGLADTAVETPTEISIAPIPLDQQIAGWHAAAVSWTQRVYLPAALDV